MDISQEELLINQYRQRLIENGNPKNMKDFLKAFSEFIEKKEGERTEEEGQEPGE